MPFNSCCLLTWDIAWKELFTSSWYHLQTEIKELIDDVRKQKSAVLTEANARELQEARQGREQNRHEYSELLRQTNQVRIQTEANFRRLDAAEILRRRTYLYDWLSAPDTESDHEHLQTVITNNDDGGKWFLRMSKFRAWFDPSSASAPLLWVTGKPGAGM